MNYRQQDGSATSWRRAYQVIINNFLGRVPTILFHEQDVVTLGEQVLEIPGPPKALTGTFDPTAEIPLVNPETGELLGRSVTHQDLYVILHSLYMQLAQQRDAAQEQLNAP